MIIPISRHNIEMLHDYDAALSRALEKTDLGKSWDIQALWDNVVNYKAYAFCQPESGYIAAFSVVASPLRRSMYVFWAGKDPENETPIDYQEVSDGMDDIARHFECSAIIVEGRKGWEKVGRTLGFTEDSRIYEKEVTYELPTIQPAASDGSESSPSGDSEQPV